MRVRVVTDSTADLPAELAEPLGIAVVPLHIYFGEEAFLDGVTITGDAFYRRIAAPGGIQPRTAAPSSGEFGRTYARIADEASDIVSIHISPRLSATYMAAQGGASEVRGRCRVCVVDSGTASLPLGLLVLEAAAMARDGAPLEDIVRVTEASVPKAHFFGALGTLEYLRRGGRIGRASAFLGSMLHVTPIIGLRQGAAYPIERVRGRQRALERICELAAGYAPLSHLAVGHTTDHEGMDELASRLSGIVPATRLIHAQCGATLGTYLGPGAYGVALLQSGG